MSRPAQAEMELSRPPLKMTQALQEGGQGQSGGKDGAAATAATAAAAAAAAAQRQASSC